MKNNTIGKLKNVMFLNENKKCYITANVGGIIASDSNGFSNLFKRNTLTQKSVSVAFTYFLIYNMSYNLFSLQHYQKKI